MEEFYIDSSGSDIEEVLLASPVRSYSPILCILSIHLIPTYIHTYTPKINLVTPIHLICMSLDGGGNIPGKIPGADTGRIWKLHTEILLAQFNTYQPAKCVFMF